MIRRRPGRVKYGECNSLEQADPEVGDTKIGLDRADEPRNDDPVDKGEEKGDNQKADCIPRLAGTRPRLRVRIAVTHLPPF